MPTRNGEKIATQDRMIFAVDVPTPQRGRELVAELGSAVRFYKLGLELFSGPDAFSFADELAAAGHRLFLDWKLHDVPATVVRAVRNLRRYTGAFVTLHCEAPLLEAACREKGDLSVLAITVLTSLDASDLAKLGYPANVSIEDEVVRRARIALECGADGVVASPLEVARLRAELGEDFLIVTPGIRPASTSVASDDQKRVTTPADAFAAGADHIVVGRPIRDAADPAAAARAIQAEIAAALRS